MNELLINSITEYIDQVKSINFGNTIFGHSLWFRAEKSNYEKTLLVPNLYREYIQGPSPMVEFFKKEASLRHLFKIEAYPFLKQYDLVYNDLGISFVMQHYGSHTRLLDWTENSLISLFFAVENIHSKHDAYIWILDPFKLNSSTTKVVKGHMVEELKLYPSLDPHEDVLKYFDTDLLKAKNLEIQYPIALKPFYIDDRMKRQSSCFTLFGYEYDGIRQHPFNKDFLQKIIIPHQYFKQIKKDLYQLGFSYDSVYPGLEGISKKTVFAFDEYFI